MTPDANDDTTETPELSGDPTHKATPTGPTLGKRLFRVGLACSLVIVAVFLIQYICAVIHYARTPDFRTFAQEHPVHERSWVERLAPDGEELGRGDTFQIGVALGAEGTKTARAVFTSTFNHGEEHLAKIEVALDFALRPFTMKNGNTSYRVDGLEASFLNRSCDPDFHPIVVVSSYGFESGQLKTASFYVDTFLLSGPGHAQIIGRTEGQYKLPDELAMPSFWGVLKMWLPDFSTPPEEGLIYRIRQGIYPDYMSYNPRVGGGGSAQLKRGEFAANTNEYSFRLTGKIEDFAFNLKDDSPFRTRTEAELKRTWNGKVW